MEATLRSAMGTPGRRPGIPPLHRAIAGFLGLVLLVTGCATVPATVPAAGPLAKAGHRTGEQIAADGAACEASARQAEDSRILRAALGSGLLAGGLVMLYGASQGAWVGLWSGAGSADGAWIGAAVGAGVGLIIGTVAGVVKAREAQSRYDSTYESCMSERARPAEPARPDGGAA